MLTVFILQESKRMHIEKVKAEAARRVAEEQKVYKRVQRKKDKLDDKEKSWIRMVKKQIVNSLWSKCSYRQQGIV